MCSHGDTSPAAERERVRLATLLSGASPRSYSTSQATMRRHAVGGQWRGPEAIPGSGELVVRDQPVGRQPFLEGVEKPSLVLEARVSRVAHELDRPAPLEPARLQVEGGSEEGEGGGRAKTAGSSEGHVVEALEGADADRLALRGFEEVHGDPGAADAVAPSERGQQGQHLGQVVGVVVRVEVREPDAPRPQRLDLRAPLAVHRPKQTRRAPRGAQPASETSLLVQEGRQVGVGAQGGELLDVEVHAEGSAGKVRHSRESVVQAGSVRDQGGRGELPALHPAEDGTVDGGAVAEVVGVDDQSQHGR